MRLVKLNLVMIFLFIGASAFANSSKPKIDFLFLIDNSGSMQSSQEHLAAEIPLFLKTLLKESIDFQAAVTTTEAYVSNFKNNPSLAEFKDGNVSDGPTGFRVVTNETPHAAEVLMQNLKQGILGSGDERAFSSFKSALLNPLNSNFRREDAHLSIIIVSDEDDASHDSLQFTEAASEFIPVVHYVDFLNQYTHSTPFYRLYTVSAFAIFDQACKEQLSNSSQKIAYRYADLINASRGEKVSLCSSFGSGLDQILQTTLKNMNR